MLVAAAALASAPAQAGPEGVCSDVPPSPSACSPAAPEPATLSLLGLAVAGIALARRRSR